MRLVNRYRIGRLEASTEEKKKYGRPNFRPGCLSVTYQTGTRFSIRRKRKEGASTRTTFLSGEDTQLRVERRKGRKSAMVRNLVSGYRRRVEFGYIWASTSHFPRCQKVFPLSIGNQARAACTHSGPRALPVGFCYHTALHHAPPPFSP
jgi:hypothetical protein